MVITIGLMEGVYKREGDTKRERVSEFACQLVSPFFSSIIHLSSRYIMPGVSGVIMWPVYSLVDNVKLIS